MDLLPGKTDLPRLGRDQIQLRAAYVAPASDIEIRLATLWRDILNIEPIGTQDDYFDLGGDSMAATRLFLEIEQSFGVRLATSEILEYPTVAKLAGFLAGHAPGKTSRCLLPLQPEGRSPPLFLLHDMSGGVMAYRHMLRRLGTGRKIFGVQYPQAIEDVTQVMSVPEMGTIYAQAIRESWPQGPFYLAGYSLGAQIAFEVANQIAAGGGEVRLLALLDGPARMNRMGGLRRRLRNISRSLFEMSDIDMRRWPGHLLGKIGRDVRRGWTRKQRRRNEGPGRPDFENLILAQSATYSLPSYQHGAKVLRGLDGTGYFSERYLGWDRFVSGPIEEFDVLANHTTIINEPRVALVAACLENWMREADLLEAESR